MTRYVPLPHQQAALRRLDHKRRQGGTTSLVVMASGLGKTALAAFDVRRWLKRQGGRVLYLCHQNEILAQARATFQEILGPNYVYGYFHGIEKTEGRVDIMFSSFQTMREWREDYPPDYFKYIVVDESHHSHAGTYLPILRYFKPRFMLALTATPDRADLRDIRDVYGPEDYSLPLEEAIAQGLLAKVDYRLLTDELQNVRILDTPVGKLSIKELNRRLFVPKRDEEIVRIINEHTAGTRNARVVIFCPSIRYANRLAGLMPHASAVHSQVTQAFHDDALKRFRTGDLSTILTVDKFNEGIDVPDANIIVFLRSTASQTIFLQQLGRGLRKVAGKRKVTVLDFVANCERLEMVHRLWTRVGEEYHRVYEGSLEEPPININVGQVQFDELALNVLEVIRSVRKGYDKSNVVKLLKALAAELGRCPTKADIDRFSRLGKSASFPTISKLFGSFSQALSEAGLEGGEPTRKYSKAEIVSDLRALALELGRTPTMPEVDAASKSHRIANGSTIMKSFGSYNAAVIEAGLIPRYVVKSKERLVDELRGLSERLGRTPTRKDVDAALKRGETSGSDYYAKNFGSFEGAIRSARLLPSKKQEWSKEEALDELCTLARRLGHTPGHADIAQSRKEIGTPGSSVYIRIFGSLDQAAEAAGLVARRYNQRRSEDELVSDLNRIVEELGRAPSHREMQDFVRKGMVAHPSTYAKVFGSWQAALRVVGLTKKSNVSSDG
jgi:superfamily II DNA or RNA helicase